MKKHGVMLFTFVILFLTLGCNLAYGQEKEGNEKVTVTLDFTKEGAFGLKNSVNGYGDITNTTFKVQDLSVSLTGYAGHYIGRNKYLRLDYDANHPGQLQISVPKPIVIDSITMRTTNNGIFIKYKNNFLSATEKKPIVESINSNNLTLTESKRTGEKAKSSYITAITLTYTRPKLDATLDEKALDAESTIKGIAGENKTLALNRTFNPSQLYTMCLPFDLSTEMIKGIFGSETKVYSYDGYQNGELSFSTVKEVNAGMPFLMRPEYYVEQPTFEGITVKSTTAQTVGGGEWDLCGTFGSYELAADGTQLFLTADGTLAKPKAGLQTMRGFRCYLKKAAGTANASAQLPSVTIDGETNAIKTAEYAPPTSATTAYSLSGMKLNAGCKTANGGIMIIDGKKFITTNR